ncbi:hypothetical protein PT974_05802 [Cladobotryum mycophilum]|uniref:Mid2 domain-containing protein n=1 Tax=Cladobotryum mycophilum TaxID=491253 RepID=A0ABR0SJS4_9HYPO
MRHLLLLRIATLAFAGALKGSRYGSLEVLPTGFTPRYVIDKSHAFVKRDGSCGAGNHGCLDINYPTRCCANDSYCYVNKANEPKCCPIGSNCVNDSFCSSTAFFCYSTITPTTTAATAIISNGGVQTQAGCCNRQCPQTSYYLCPSSLGGGCCPFGSECQNGGHCVSTKTAEPTPRLTPVVEGCTTEQYKCADGNGCCGNTQLCTSYQGSGYCTDGNPTATPTGGISPDPPSSSKSSSGKTIGIAVGISVGGAFIIGGVIWLLFVRRRQDKQIKSNEQTEGEADASDDPTMTAVTPSTLVASSSPGDGTQPTPPFPESSPASPLPVLHEPNGPEAAPVEIDSAERLEADDTEVDPLSPRPGATELGSPIGIEGRYELPGSEPAPPAPMTSWLEISPPTPSPSPQKEK